MTKLNIFVGIALVVFFVISLLGGFILTQKTKLDAANLQNALLEGNTKAQNVAMKALNTQYAESQKLVSTERSLAKQRADILQNAKTQDCVQGVVDDETSKNVVSHINSILYTY